MSNSLRRTFKKKTQEEKISQIGKVQFDMWLKLDKMSKELRKVQDILGIGKEEEIGTDESE